MEVKGNYIVKKLMLARTVQVTDGIYFGDGTTENDLRIIRSGNNLNIEVLHNEVWEVIKYFVGDNGTFGYSFEGEAEDQVNGYGLGYVDPYVGGSFYTIPT